MYIYRYRTSKTILPETAVKPQNSEKLEKLFEAINSIFPNFKFCLFNNNYILVNVH